MASVNPWGSKCMLVETWINKAMEPNDTGTPQENVLDIVQYEWEIIECLGNRHDQGQPGECSWMQMNHISNWWQMINADKGHDDVTFILMGLHDGIAARVRRPCQKVLSWELSSGSLGDSTLRKSGWHFFVREKFSCHKTGVNYIHIVLHDLHKGSTHLSDAE
jgi:hypothetical protein